jgi:MtN3 and saliva related transmembrane protein
MHDLSGWIAVALGQMVAWPQVLRLCRQRGDGVSLLTYLILLVSMSLYLLHAVEIRDAVTTASVSLAYVPNVVIAVILIRRRVLDGGSIPNESDQASTGHALVPPECPGELVTPVRPAIDDVLSIPQIFERS